jgi:starch phosphorylase
MMEGQNEKRVLRRPRSISRLGQIAYNFWWSWQPDARKLFGRLEPTLWKRTQHSPVEILRSISQERMEEVARDPSFLKHYNQVLKAYDAAHGKRETWFNQRFPDIAHKTIAYFSAEFGIHNSLPIYSGGLGLLSGDHCKEAGGIGIPLVGVGFLYQEGYFHQRIHADGWQEAVYRPLATDSVALRPASDTGARVLIEIPVGAGNTVYAVIWKVQVGSVLLYLLDTDVPENQPWDRALSARLYPGDKDFRIRQQIVLGIGAVRALRALHIAPSVWHLNEGHTAFTILERIREWVASGLSFDEAAHRVRESTIFTTHTPVAAGHDTYPSSLIEKYFSHYWPSLGVDLARFWGMGQFHESWGESFNMTALSLRFSDGHNAVAALNGKISRRMWHVLWPNNTEEEVPIISITNGIHVPTWVAHELRPLYEKHLATDWIDCHDDEALWKKILNIQDNLFWKKHLFLKRKMLRFIQDRARVLWAEKRVDPSQVLSGGALLDPDTFTIGYARRFTAYKRPTLLLHDLARLKRILTDRWHPVQIIFAGKAHPDDDVGKRAIQQIYNMARDPEYCGRIAFIENYDMRLAHDLVQGVDLWLNTPRPPFEACGTSGMKAALNGVPTLGARDGWWVEGFNGRNGWAFGKEVSSTDAVTSADADDIEDANEIYALLENEIVPLYYKRGAEGVPHEWVHVAKEAIASVGAAFSARRMMKEYTEKLYVPAARKSDP